MQRFTNILVADFTTTEHPPPALKEAARLAHGNDARLTLSTVVAPPPPQQRDLRLGSHAEPVSELVSRQRQARLVRFASALGYDHTDVGVSVGSPAPGLVEQVVRDGHDLLVVSSDGTESTAALVRTILRLCPAPVWVLRSGFTGSRILAAIDPGDPPALNGFILELAGSQARRYGGELHVLHAWEPYAEHLTFGGEPLPVGPGLITAYASDAERAHESAFEATVADTRLGIDAKTHLVEGTPARAITGLVDLYRIDLLVMGVTDPSDGDSSGRTAEQLFGKVRCSVLVGKPDGFDTSNGRRAPAQEAQSSSGP